MLIQIPADLTIVTLTDGHKTFPQRFTTQYTQQLLTEASAILESRAKIRFTRGECKSVTENVVPGVQGDALNDAGFHFLALKIAGRTRRSCTFCGPVSSG